MSKHRTLRATSREDQEHNIDDFLAEGVPHVDVPLILPASGSASRFKYRGLTVRRWQDGAITRYDTAVELK